MARLDGCQLPNLPPISEGLAEMSPQPMVGRLKRMLAKPWNSIVKIILKRAYYSSLKFAKKVGLPTKKTPPISGDPTTYFQSGDWVRVRSKSEIESTLDPFKELKGCAFLENMAHYCGTVQRVLKPVERFLDERDYKVKKARGIVLLEGVFCPGTHVYGRCDRACHLFWREEWLERVENPVR